MTFTRLLAAVLVLGSVSASAQKGSQSDTAVPGSPPSSHHLFFWGFPGNASTPSEPWRLVPEQTSDAHSQGNPLDRIRLDRYDFNNDISRHDSNPLTKSVLPNPFHFAEKPQQEAETSCLSIRSYVVERDSKDSDSTHPVSYSTCQPTERYRLKSTEIRVDSPDR